MNDEARMAALLGRPLSTVETTNFDLYLDIAAESLEDLLCTTLEDHTGERFFDTRKGYSTAFVDIFRSVSEVKIDGEVIDAENYSLRQWDKRSGSWYNSLVFDDKFTCNGELAITAEWGFETSSGYDTDWPTDLQTLLAGLFDLITKKNKLNGSISSKQVEDFRISFNTAVDLDIEFQNKYRMAISKYSLCNIGNVQHGKVSCGRYIDR